MKMSQCPTPTGRDKGKGVKLAFMAVGKQVRKRMFEGLFLMLLNKRKSFILKIDT